MLKESLLNPAQHFNPTERPYMQARALLLSPLHVNIYLSLPVLSEPVVCSGVPFCFPRFFSLRPAGAALPPRPLGSAAPRSSLIVPHQNISSLSPCVSPSWLCNIKVRGDGTVFSESLLEKATGSRRRESNAVHNRAGEKNAL